MISMKIKIYVFLPWSLPLDELELEPWLPIENNYHVVIRIISNKKKVSSWCVYLLNSPEES